MVAGCGRPRDGWRPIKGKNIVRGYRKHFGVDSVRAIRELHTLGVRIDPPFEQAVLAQAKGRHRRPSRNEIRNSYAEESNAELFCIAGHTSGGVAYGIRREEVPELDRETGLPVPLVEDPLAECGPDLLDYQTLF